MAVLGAHSRCGWHLAPSASLRFASASLQTICAAFFCSNMYVVTRVRAGIMCYVESPAAMHTFHFSEFRI